MRILLAALGVAMLLFGSVLAANGTTIKYEPGNLGYDTFINSSSPNTNTGSENRLVVNNYSAYLTYTLIKFDIYSFDIPPGSTVTAAILGLYCNNQYPTSTILNVETHKILSSWIEGSVTWSNKPSINAGMESSADIGGTGTWYTWNLASLVQSWVNNPSQNYGVALYSTSATEAWKEFRSSDYNSPISQRPYLEITFTPVPIPGAVWLFGSALAGLVGLRRLSRR